MEEAAKVIAAEQAFRQSDDQEPIGGADVVARLINATTTRTGRSQKTVIEAKGATIGLVDRDRSRGFTITLNPTDLSADDILEALRPVDREGQDPEASSALMGVPAGSRLSRFATLQSGVFVVSYQLLKSSLPRVG